MKLSTKQSCFTFYVLLGCATLLFFPLLLTTGCTPAEVQAVKTDVSAGLAALEANKSLAEQFVRDVKGNMDLADPRFDGIMERYERARDDYNSYLSQMETSARTGQKVLNVQTMADTLASSTTNFISAAARGLDPNVSNRNLQVSGAIVVPPMLSRSVLKLQRDVRKAIADRLATDLHWKAWDQL
jgi:hypothetical protein